MTGKLEKTKSNETENKLKKTLLSLADGTRVERAKEIPQSQVQIKTLDKTQVEASVKEYYVK